MSRCSIRLANIRAIGCAALADTPFCARLSHRETCSPHVSTAQYAVRRDALGLRPLGVIHSWMVKVVKIYICSMICQIRMHAGKRRQGTAEWVSHPSEYSRSKQRRHIQGKIGNPIFDFEISGMNNIGNIQILTIFSNALIE